MIKNSINLIFKSTSNYHARKFGVRSAMPGYIALKLCPELKIVKPDFKKYHQAGEEIRSVLKNYDPDFYSPGLDEAYLDITEIISATQNPIIDTSKFDSKKSKAWNLVQKMREDVFKQTQLTCSAGIGPNKPIAKIASDYNKPDNQWEVESSHEKVLEFIQNLPVNKVNGIGAVSSKILNGLGIKTCGDVLEYFLTILFSTKF